MATYDKYLKEAEALLRAVKPQEPIVFTTRWGNDPEEDTGPGVHIRTKWTSSILQRNEDNDEQ